MRSAAQIRSLCASPIPGAKVPVGVRYHLCVRRYVTACAVPPLRRCLASVTEVAAGWRVFPRTWPWPALCASRPDVQWGPSRRRRKRSCANEYLGFRVTGIVADPPRLSVTVTDPGLVKDVEVVGPGGTLRLFWMPPSCQALLLVKVPSCVPLAVTNTV
jgi:hypothetical protein